MRVQGFNPSFGGFISKTYSRPQLMPFQSRFNPSFGGFISKTGSVRH